jgi:H+/Cl- antiporter ClcA
MYEIMKIIKTTVLLIIAFLVSLNYGMAQCAMCRVTIENNVSNGDTTIGAGLNLGILYLFITPYLLIAVLGFLWYRHSKKRKQLQAGNRRY